jgi:hypothetical protein
MVKVLFLLFLFSANFKFSLPPQYFCLFLMKKRLTIGLIVKRLWVLMNPSV